MRIAANIIAVLLGALFVFGAVMMLSGKVTPPPMPEGTPVDHFMKAFIPTGYMTVIKVLELVGGILVMVPKVRSLGLLVLGPIIVNICLFHLLVEKADFVPVPLLIGLASLFLLWVDRRKWAGLLS